MCLGYLISHYLSNSIYIEVLSLFQSAKWGIKILRYFHYIIILWFSADVIFSHVNWRNKDDIEDCLFHKNLLYLINDHLTNVKGPCSVTKWWDTTTIVVIEKEEKFCNQDLKKYKDNLHNCVIDAIFTGYEQIYLYICRI